MCDFSQQGREIEEFDVHSIDTDKMATFINFFLFPLF
jgi:hypothetical protein